MNCDPHPPRTEKVRQSQQDLYFRNVCLKLGWWPTPANLTQAKLKQEVSKFEASLS